MDKKALVISGPTASGKSDLALKISDFCDIAIINADSLQVYEGLPILSSQPSFEEQKKVKHFLYSHFKPFESCSVGIWLKLLRLTLDEVFAAGKKPVIVGGSGMYISKIFDGIVEIPEISEDVRSEARSLYDKIGKEEFQKKLLEIGEGEIPDRQRLIRAYEVFLQSGKTLSWWQKQENKKLFEDVSFVHINLNPIREKLYQNCDLRFEKMIKQGAFDEVESFIKRGAIDDWQITRTLGFYEIRDFLQGKISQEEMIKISTQKTRNYAKRQFTWFRNQLPQKFVFEEVGAALEFIAKRVGDFL